jgi:hypothetical protein
MPYKTTILAAALAAGAVLVLTAAGFSNSGDHQKKPSADATRSQIRVSHVKSYSTLAGLRADSSAVVEITAGEQHPEELAGLPVTVTSASIKRVAWGEIPAGRTIELRQIGTSQVLGVDTSKLLVPGTDYLVFVVPSSGALDAAPNRFLITGDAGLYELQRDQYLYRGGNTDPNRESSLPATVQSTTMETAVAS